MSAHTPGPWANIGGFIGTAEDDPQTIAYVSDHRNRRSTSAEVMAANARLIASAPDLLEVARNLVSFCANRREWLGALSDELAALEQSAITAIRKVTGESA